MIAHSVIELEQAPPLGGSRLAVIASPREANVENQPRRSDARLMYDTADYSAGTRRSRSDRLGGVATA